MFVLFPLFSSLQTAITTVLCLIATPINNSKQKCCRKEAASLCALHFEGLAPKNAKFSGVKSKTGVIFIQIFNKIHFYEALTWTSRTFFLVVLLIFCSEAKTLANGIKWFVSFQFFLHKRTPHLSKEQQQHLLLITNLNFNDGRKLATAKN